MANSKQKQTPGEIHKKKKIKTNKQNLKLFTLGPQRGTRPI